MTRQTHASERADAIFSVLAHQRRRSLLSTLVDQEGQAEFTVLAGRLAAAENRTRAESVTEEMTTRVRAGVSHADLPKLEDAGLVAFDEETGQVTLTENADRIHGLSALVREMEESPDEHLERAIPDATEETG